MKKTAVTIVKVTFITLCALFILIQLVPYGRDHHNPAVMVEPPWDSPKTRVTAKVACFDCHSNETVWPWYSWVAPVSWLLARDVQEGRRELNFSEWQGGTRKGESPDKIREEMDEGEMPPFSYLVAHPEARLAADESRQLAEGLAATARRGGAREKPAGAESK